MLSRGLLLSAVIPAAERAVENTSIEITGSSETVPAGIRPGPSQQERHPDSALVEHDSAQSGGSRIRLWSDARPNGPRSRSCGDNPGRQDVDRGVILFTTVPERDWTDEAVLEWYRTRWQVELVFKRFKSLAQLGCLPKYSDESAKAWLYGKLVAALLVEKLIHHAGALSP